ncbi:MAG: cation:proton antiporter [Microcystis novacekii Mn_MB_F_20050700_S1]|uniref:Cation:proton antiporter n=1 Tax=Microcystis novacekii Mn_MB_F_20050700_S1D TaxID=2486266 RepID=A0A552IT81_9CHRO|nr:MAG: cation:proton antiporter [Microcystis novacekii Mn_MB_F_20050700_S1]TRU86642.1 MAG: cation:proton antiporter [Microcystis novacekii Mn_MB_F_20050700_S1D]
MPTNHDIAVRLFLQISVILLTCQISSRVFHHLGQTRVVSEMIAGVLLGPSFLGLIAPDVQEFLFPKTLTLALGGSTIDIIHPSMTILFGLSQLGLVLYMFLIGLQFNVGMLSDHIKEASLLSLSGILSPLLLGGGLGFILSTNNSLFPQTIVPWQAALFMSSAMVITAFPMLARIIYESGLTNSKIGTLAISAAAFDDAVAWAMLAIILATSKNSPVLILMALGGTLVYVITMTFVGRPLFRLFSQATAANKGVTPEIMTALLFTLMLSAWFTDLVRIYAIFGAFMLGAVMPRGVFAKQISGFIEYLNVTLLLPMFFVYSGLNTQIALLAQSTLIGITIITIVIAFICKGGACLLATRIGGSTWREAGLIGALMNARGLMELILVNIGLDNHIITPALFTILVLMAIVTTVAASPLFRLLSAKQNS